MKTENRKIITFENMAKINDLKNEISKLSNKNLNQSEVLKIQNRIRRIVEELKEDYNADVADVEAGRVDVTIEEVKAHYRKADKVLVNADFDVNTIVE